MKLVQSFSDHVPLRDLAAPRASRSGNLKKSSHHFCYLTCPSPSIPAPGDQAHGYPPGAAVPPLPRTDRDDGLFSLFVIRPSESRSMRGLFNDGDQPSIACLLASYRQVGDRELAHAKKR